MKKYTEYLEEKYIPLTRDEMDGLRTGVCSANDTEGMLLDEIDYLRGLLSESYNWLGRKARSPMPKRYTNLMREAYRIYREEKGARKV